MFLMADLKVELENIAIKMMNMINVKELCGKADKYGCKSLLNACAKFMVEEGVCLDGEEVKKMPDAAAACMEAFKGEMDKKRNLEIKLKKVEEQLAGVKMDRRWRCTFCHKSKPDGQLSRCGSCGHNSWGNEY